MDEELPKGTVHQLIKEALPEGFKCSVATKDVLTQCCSEFVTMLLAEAVEQVNQEKKKRGRLGPEHVMEAVASLGFAAYAKELAKALAAFKGKPVPRKSRKRKALTSEEEAELEQEQQRLFAEAAEDVELAGGGGGGGGGKDSGVKGSGGGGGGSKSKKGKKAKGKGKGKKRGGT